MIVDSEVSDTNEIASEQCSDLDNAKNSCSPYFTSTENLDKDKLIQIKVEIKTCSYYFHLPFNQF